MDNESSPKLKDIYDRVTFAKKLEDLWFVKEKCLWVCRLKKKSRITALICENVLTEYFIFCY